MLKNSKFENLTLAVALFFGLLGSIGYFYKPAIPRDKNRRPIATILLFKDDVQISPGSSTEWFKIPYFGKTEIFENDLILTGEASEAQLRLQDGEEILISSNTLIAFRKNSKGNIEFQIEYGKIPVQTLVPPINSKNKFVENIKLLDPPSGEFVPVPVVAETSVLPEVAFDPFKLLQESDLTSEKSKKLTGALAVKNLQVFVPDRKGRWKGKTATIEFEWNEVSEGQDYEVVISKIENSKIEVFKKLTTQEPRIKVNELLPGPYEVQVLTNLTLDHWSQVYAAKEIQKATFLIPEILKLENSKATFPENKQTVIQNPNTNLYFEWLKSTNATDYVMQISKDNDFNEVSFEFWVTENFINEKIKLMNGVWYWRVAAVSEQGQSSWSEVAQFKLLLSAL